MNRAKGLVGALSLLAVVVACGAPAVTSTPGQTSAPSDAIAAVIADYQQEIPRLMREHNVPGLSVAVVDDRGLVWSEGFGVTDIHGSEPVTSDTVFSIQSTSKVFTATAVLLAVQDGVLDLDEPITAYLPEFTVHSIFEEHPEAKITLRHLLSHTAGFTHEAPVGNNWDEDAGSFDEHIRSISDTWLRFPVGTGYAYSNLGIDLAGYVLQQVTGRTFVDYVQDHLFEPLAMTNSSFDADAIRANDKRAIGHAPPAPRIFRPVPMVAAGGMYSSANDLARFVQFQLGDGVVDGRAVLDPALLDEMLTVQFPERGERYGYGLGVARTGWYRGRNADLFSHGGGGFGFSSDLWWLPELQLGIVVLTNSDHDLQGSLALGILDDMVHAAGPYRDRLGELPAKSAVEEGWGDWLPPESLAKDIRAQARPPDPAGWQRYLGEYKTPDWGVIDPATPPSRVLEDGGTLYFDGADIEDTGDPPQVLHEVEPGLFFTETGEALDFRTDPPTFRNLELRRVGAGPAPPVRAVLAICGLVMLVALLAAPARRVRRLLHRQTTEELRPVPRRSTDIAVTGLAAAASLCGLASIAVLVIYPRMIYSGFMGWLDLGVGQRLLLHAPLGLVVCTVALAAMAVWGWRQGWWRGHQRWIHSALIAAALVEISFLATWGLIGL
jgi:CubicO group peptidase (beta-lactamase class C family)